jgi:diacylglycerol O-acyltransferase-1
MSTAYRRSAKVVTDSEDDQSDSRQRRDLRFTSRRVSTINEEKPDDKKKKTAPAATPFGPHHTIPIHTLSKASVLSKEAPPENYSGFIRLGSKLNQGTYEGGINNELFFFFLASACAWC